MPHLQVISSNYIAVVLCCGVCCGFVFVAVCLWLCGCVFVAVLLVVWLCGRVLAVLCGCVNLALAERSGAESGVEPWLLRPWSKTY